MNEAVQCIEEAKALMDLVIESQNHAVVRTTLNQVRNMLEQGCASIIDGEQYISVESDPDRELTHIAKKVRRMLTSRLNHIDETSSDNPLLPPIQKILSVIDTVTEGDGVDKVAA